MDEPLLFVSAGDPSGDNATSRAMARLKEIRPGLKLVGLGGPRLQALGQEQLADPADLAVLGFWEVAKRYFYFRNLFNRCLDEIKDRRPKAILLVDYPGFNLRLAKRIRPLGIPIIYYISPQVWAWGKRRIKDIRACVDRMLVILPFEERFYRDHGVSCDFVGHYLLEDIPPEYVATTPPDNGQLALLPGSRPQEVARMLPTMLRTARLMRDRHGSRSVVAAIRGVYDYEAALAGDDRIELVYNDARKVVYESDIVLTASGTATLETGIIGRPMVIVYRTGFITYHIAKRLVKLDTIGLINLVLDQKVVPELIQHEANPQAIATELSRFVTDPAYAERTYRRLHDVPEVLGGGGAAERTAEVIGSYL
ncbi:MAG: lipid-A-disaccharide synthase [candidate division Zixibacteria bacterium]|nr:lipid-A-disaccharide synthase [candidate division Zixibacteria bacterium]